MSIDVSEVDAAIDQFEKLQDLDPYRLENMDTFSNLLYVKVNVNLQRHFMGIEPMN